MSIITISGTVSDSAGGSAPFSVTVNIDAVTITSATVAPDPAPAGTLRTLTILAASSSGLPLTFATPTAKDGGGNPITFTPVAGKPNQFTFTV